MIGASTEVSFPRLIKLFLAPVTMSDTAQSLSLERKIKMHEARESIITRLALAFPTTINLDRFLNVIVSELGRMMNVDRCDVIQLTSQVNCESAMNGGLQLMFLPAWAR